MASSSDVTLPLGAYVQVYCTDDGPAEVVHGAFGIVCGTGVYSGCSAPLGLNGDRVIGACTYKTPGYKLLVIGCTHTEHMSSLGTIRNIAKTFVRLVKPGDFTKSLERWSKNSNANNQKYAAVGHSLRMLVAREEYTIRNKGKGYFESCQGRHLKSKWSHMYPGTEYPSTRR